MRMTLCFKYLDQPQITSGRQLVPWDYFSAISRCLAMAFGFQPPRDPQAVASDTQPPGYHTAPRSALSWP